MRLDSGEDSRGCTVESECKTAKYNRDEYESFGIRSEVAI